nr:hypothetical protein [Hyphomonas sp. Mor2]
MDKTLLFWILVGGLGFAFALAVQMRVITALVLRRALKDWREEFADRMKANAIVVAAASQAAPENDAVAYMQETYPSPLAHLRTARRYSVILPVLLIGVLALGRLVWGVI